MHDPQYRVEVARQQTTYNQPAYPSFYLGSDIDWAARAGAALLDSSEVKPPGPAPTLS